jgi:hypothetical protein
MAEENPSDATDQSSRPLTRQGSAQADQVDFLSDTRDNSFARDFDDHLCVGPWADSPAMSCVQKQHGTTPAVKVPVAFLIVMGGPSHLHSSLRLKLARFLLGGTTAPRPSSTQEFGILEAVSSKIEGFDP